MTSIEVFFFLLCLSGIMIISYKDLALRKGWTIGEYYDSDVSVVRTLGGLSFLGSLIVSFFYIKWYLVVFGVILAWVMAARLTFFLKEKAQFVSILLLLSSFIVLFF